MHNILNMPRGTAKRDAATKENTKKVSEKKMQMIQLIKEYPILYDLAHVDHKNAAMKLVIWEQIASILGETGK